MTQAAGADVDTALPALARARNLDSPTWNTLTKTFYPDVPLDVVALAVDYCRARHLDILKKPVHCVMVHRKNKRGDWVESWQLVPSVYETRMTAHTSGQYLGHSKPVEGPALDYRGTPTVEWIEMTVYRWHEPTGQRIEFPMRTYFREVVTLDKDGKPNQRWARAPRQMLLKCCESAALREAFPDALTNEPTAEEIEGARIGDDDSTTTVDVKPLPTKPDGFDDWLIDLEAVADDSFALLKEAWTRAPAVCREYLTATAPTRLDELKTRARDADVRRAAADEPPGESA